MDEAAPDRPTGARGSHRYLPQLDGLRALAVAAVVARHAKVPFLGGGGRGADVFFVLSGYLITTLLLEEGAASHTIGLGRFYRRRWNRLVPAMVAVIAVMVPLFIAFRPYLWRETVIGGATVYAAAFVRGLGTSDLGYMGHLWSLSVEE